MVGDSDVYQSPTIMAEDDQHKQHPEGNRRYDEQVHGHYLARVIRQKHSPRLGRWAGMPSHVDGKLMSEGDDLQVQRGPRPDQEPQRVEHRDDDR
jgi:hypothetical protein